MLRLQISLLTPLHYLALPSSTFRYIFLDRGFRLVLTECVQAFHQHKAIHMHIKVHGPVNERTVNTAKGPFTFRDQQAYLFLDDLPYPVPFQIGVPEGTTYDPSVEYALSSSSFVTDERGRLALSAFNMTLIPVVKQATRAA